MADSRKGSRNGCAMPRYGESLKAVSSESLTIETQYILTSHTHSAATVCFPPNSNNLRIRDVAHTVTLPTVSDDGDVITQTRRSTWLFLPAHPPRPSHVRYVVAQLAVHSHVSQVTWSILVALLPLI